MQRKVEELLRSPDLARVPDVAEMLARIGGRSGTASEFTSAPEPEASLARSERPSADIVEKLTNAKRLFYAGDYLEAIDALTEVLSEAPGNEEARDRLAQAEDNLRRGIVPDNRVPFEARAAYGRAQSLERAGRFEEGRASYQAALEAARKAGPILQNWQPAVEAMVRVENSIIAHETRDEGDAFLQEDRWPEAIEKYAAVLRLLPDDSHSRERLSGLQTILEQYETARGYLKAKAADSVEASESVKAFLQSARVMRPKLATSKRLEEIEAEIDKQAQALQIRMIERSRQLLTQADSTSILSERIRVVHETLDLLKQVLFLAPDDGELFELEQGARAQLALLEQIRANLDEAHQEIRLDSDKGLRQARDILNDIQGYEEDTAYSQLVGNLHRQYLERSESALGQKKFREASRWLARAKESPFDVLGRTEEVLALENEVSTAARRQQWLRTAGFGGGIVAILLLVVGFSRPLRALGIASATPTSTPTEPSPSETMAPTETTAPSLTPTSSSTPTSTPLPSDTPVPTLTSTTASTPTDTPLFGAVAEETAARLSPDGGAPWAFTLRAADPVQVLGSVEDADGRTWYKI